MGRRFRNVVFAAFLLAPPAIAAQVAIQPTPAPTVTADNASWYQARDPIMFAGNVYYPAGAQVHFNRNEMTFSGYYAGVPIYTKVTVEPYSLVFVPLSGGVMQPYERRRTGEIAGTVGSTTPSFPVVSPAEAAASGQLPVVPLAAGPATSYFPSPTDPAPVPVATTGTTSVIDQSQGLPRHVMIGRKPEGLNGIYIDYNGARWFSNGPAVRLEPGRYTQIGVYRGFPVYRQKGDADTVFVAVAESVESLLAPYSTRRGPNR
jgi:hypothetical protein